MKPIDMRARINRRALECPDNRSFDVSACAHLHRDPAPGISRHQVATVISLAERRASMAAPVRAFQTGR
jgi:hypothetical protein